MQAQYLSEGKFIDYTPSSAVAAGAVVEIGTIPMIATQPIAANVLGALAKDGEASVVKDSSTFAAGDAVYWDNDGSPVGGVALSGAATSTASGNNLMGIAGAAAATGVTTVTTELTAAKRTTAIAGIVTADSVTGSSATLPVAGKAGAGGGAGGTATVTGGVGHTNGAGGAVGLTGGAGAGTGAGGVAPVAGGASGTGATGNGGAVSLTGGAALSTNGNGGAASVAGGVATGTGTGGAATITSGASAGASGTAGAVNIDCGAATGGTAGAITIGGTNAASITVGKMPRIPSATVAAAGTGSGDGPIVEGFTLVSGADGTKAVTLPTAIAGAQCIIKNVVAQILKVFPNTSDKINGGTATTGYLAMPASTSVHLVAYDATDWYSLPLLPS